MSQSTALHTRRVWDRSLSCIPYPPVQILLHQESCYNQDIYSGYVERFFLLQYSYSLNSKSVSNSLSITRVTFSGEAYHFIYKYNVTNPTVISCLNCNLRFNKA